MNDLPDPVILVPGITATYLKDFYSLPPDTVWSVLKHEYKRTALHPDSLNANLAGSKKIYEALEPARVVADQVFEISYKNLVEELKDNLSPEEDTPVPVYTFGYDWRQPLEIIEDQLAEFVEEVISRTLLMRHYHEDGYAERKKVNLIGHSMGGLVITGYLSRHEGAPVNKVATLATPFLGSFEAVIKVATGTANLGTSPPSSRERRAARVTPALYYLIPSFENGLTIADGIVIDETKNKDLYNPDVWQQSIIDTIAKYIQLHSVTPGDQEKQKENALKLFSAMLKSAHEHNEKINGLDLQNIGLSKEDWLCIVGVGAKTRVKLDIANIDGEPSFNFRSGDRKDLWKKREKEEEGKKWDEESRRQTGDGTVPFEGAKPEFLDHENLVCLSPDDFGYWEIGDKLAMKVGGFHGLLPSMNVIHRILVRFFTGREDKRNNTWGRPPPGITEDNEDSWEPPLPLNAKFIKKE